MQRKVRLARAPSYDAGAACSACTAADLISADRTTLKYVEPPQPGTSEEKLVTTTVFAYDSQQLKALYKGQLIGIGMMAVMHLYFKFSSPLMVQSVIPLKTAFEGNLVKIHLFGQPATGDLERPFKAGAGLMGMLMGGGEIKKDKKSIETAEKSGKGGAKEE
jgi:Phosphate transport (Pho88)